MKWTVIDKKVAKLDENFDLDYKEIGIHRYDCSPDDDCMNLFLHLWPGKWREQLEKENYLYGTTNKIEIKEYVSKGYFLQFIGVLCAASVYRCPSSVKQGKVISGQCYPN